MTQKDILMILGRIQKPIAVGNNEDLFVIDGFELAKEILDFIDKENTQNKKMTYFEKVELVRKLKEELSKEKGRIIRKHIGKYKRPELTEKIADEMMKCS
jgi:hypothetical protein